MKVVDMNGRTKTTLKAGDRFNIMVHADMILRPYKSQKAGW